MAATTQQRVIPLPVPLRRLVSWSVAILGEVIRQELGNRRFQAIEELRREMAGLRNLGIDKQHGVLRRRLRLMRRISPKERHNIAHAFTLMLEVMNSAEAAYRTFYHSKAVSAAIGTGRKVSCDVTWVLTAHPTEARAPENIEAFQRLQHALVEVLREFPEHPENCSIRLQRRVRYLIGLAWKIPVARNRKPSIEDEADHIYSISLRREVVREFLEAADSHVTFHLRTWVGGDKDGHTGVDERAMLASLALSRARLITIASDLCLAVRKDARLARDRGLDKEVGTCLSLLRKLKTPTRGERPTLLRVADFARRAISESDEPHPALRELRALLSLFPALVMPLELRDSRTEIARGARGENVPIRRMLRALQALSRGGDPRDYARNLIVSMTEDVADVRAATQLVRSVFGADLLPVVPLLEKRSALEGASALVRAMTTDPEIRRSLRSAGHGKIEIMLGYSDSAKEIGVLLSRTEILEAMRAIEIACRGSGFRPVFFHGSGGSVDRGGGSIREQTSGWPKEAILRFKATVQGEMVERSLSSPEILRSQLERISEIAEAPRRSAALPGPATRAFAHAVSAEYRRKVASPGFMELIQGATPYRYLHELKIGSRPVRRSASFSASGAEGAPLVTDALRAIPWVLCWTQTRILFPTWWGVGSAWTALDARERGRLITESRRDPLLSSFVKLLGFTLAKTELAVWRIHLESSPLPREKQEAEYREFEREYRKALAFVRALSGRRDLVWFRPWLGTSIGLRSPMIHPLNLIQIIALQESDRELIRETVTGISSGMMTTG